MSNEQERPRSEHEELGRAFRLTMLAHHAGSTFEAERVRLAVAEKLADRRNATRTVEELTAEAETEIKAKQEAAQAVPLSERRGIEMPADLARVQYIDPVSGAPTEFPGSAAPLAPGMMPPGSR